MWPREVNYLGDLQILLVSAAEFEVSSALSFPSMFKCLSTK